MKNIKPAGKSLKILKNENVDVAIDSLGAKVLAINIDGENILYYDENDIKHSGIPICLPFFGPLRNGILTIGDNEFLMSQHGFFRDSEFKLYNGGKKVLAIFKSNNDTLNRFPFKFNFKVTFEILDNGLKMDFVLKNEDSKTMGIAPGFHPYFAVKDRENIFITTKAKTGNNSLNNFVESKLEDTQFFKIENMDRGLRKLHIINAPNIQLIDHQLNDTSIFPGNGKEIILSADMNIFNRMTVWRPKADVDYICVEPSFVENAINTGNGIQLKRGQEFCTAISIIKK